MSQSLWGWVRQRGWQLANVAILLAQLSLLPYDPDHTRFWPNILGGVFTLISYTAGSFALAFLIFRKNLLRTLFFAQLFSTFWMSLTALREYDIFYTFNGWMDKVFVLPVFDFTFMHAATFGGSQIGPFFYGVYAGVALLIYGNWFVKNKKLKDGYWKVERQVIWTGLGVYGIINMMIWMFTHFSFVSSNYINMEYLMKYVDKVVVQYDREDRTDLFALKELRYFKTLDEVEAYYSRPEWLARSGGADRKGFYDAVLNNIDMLKRHGFAVDSKMSYDKMERFHDWMSVVFNTRYLGSDEATKRHWMLELSSVRTNEPNWQDVTRHSLFYVKQRDNGDYYVYFAFDRSFKDYRQNYLYNVFFVLFHLVFLPLFAYLVHLHRRDNLKKSAVAKQAYGDEIEEGGK